MSDHIDSEEILLPDFEKEHHKIEIEDISDTIDDQDETKSSIFLDLQPQDDCSSPLMLQSVNTNDNQIICIQTNDVRCITNVIEVCTPRPIILNKPLKTYSLKNATHTIAIPVAPITTVPSISSSETEVLNTEDCKINSGNNEIVAPLRQRKPLVKTYGKTKVKTEDDAPKNDSRTPKKAANSDLVIPPRKKRRLLLDTFKVIPNSEFKQQLQNTKDIVQKKADIAPATKKAMHFLAYGGVGKFFAYPGRKILSVPLAKLFFSHLTVTTEIRSVLNDGQIAPLDPELRTPPSGTSKYEGIIVSYMGPHLYNDSLAKRAANSFDHLIKGMNVLRTKKSHDRQEESRKVREYRKSPLEEIQSIEMSSLLENEAIISNVLDAGNAENISDNLCVKLEGNELVGEAIALEKVIVAADSTTETPIEEDGVHEDGVHEDGVHEDGVHDDGVVDNPAIDMDFSSTITEGDSLVVKMEEKDEESVTHILTEPTDDTFVHGEVSENSVIFTMDDTKTTETFEESESVFFCNDAESSEQEASQSNLEMLLAAAEQHHGTMEIADNIEISSEVLQDIEVDEANSETKNGIVYCTAESDADGGLVIVDSSGRRYTISSNSSGLTLWPEST